MRLISKKYNSNNIYSMKINEILLSNREDIPEKDRVYLQDIKGVRIGNNPQVFYYYYENREYYFTAKDALFSVDLNGNITWYYGEWLDGFFRNGTWINGTWHMGTWCNGNWIDGTWISGTWYKGKIDGTPSDTNP